MITNYTNYYITNPLQASKGRGIDKSKVLLTHCRLHNVGGIDKSLSLTTPTSKWRFEKLYIGTLPISYSKLNFELTSRCQKSVKSENLLLRKLFVF